MTYLINRLQQTGIITITYSGDVFVNDRINAMEEAHTLLKKNHDKKLIIDVRKINNKMTESEQEDFGVFLAEKFTSQKTKVAVIHPKKNSQADIIIDGIAFLHGCRLAQFYTLQDAELWLMGK